MAVDFYSDHYTGTVSGTTQDDPRIKIPSGLSHGKIHYKRGSITTTAATAATDILRFFQLKSSDRILELLLTTPGDAGTAVTLNLGVHTTDGGAAIVADLFASAVDVKAAVARVDQFVENADLEQADRGKKLYELVDEWAASAVYDDDPTLLWDISGVIAGETAIAGAEIVLECYYVPGTTA